MPQPTPDLTILWEQPTLSSCLSAATPSGVGPALVGSEGALDSQGPPAISRAGAGCGTFSQAGQEGGWWLQEMSGRARLAVVRGHRAGSIVAS